MRKLLGALIFSLLFSSSLFAETVSQRLDKIEERLKKIEESLEGLEILSSIMKNPESTLLDALGTKSNNDLSANQTNNTKLKIETRKLECIKEDFGENIYFNYLLYNNYDQGIKYVDAIIVVKDLFDEVLLKTKILKNANVASKKSKFFKSSMSDMFSDDCRKLKQAEFDDYKYELIVSKIAFEDNSIAEFNQ